MLATEAVASSNLFRAAEPDDLKPGKRVVILVRKRINLDVPDILLVRRILLCRRCRRQHRVLVGRILVGRVLVGRVLVSRVLVSRVRLGEWITHSERVVVVARLRLCRRIGERVGRGRVTHRVANRRVANRRIDNVRFAERIGCRRRNGIGRRGSRWRCHRRWQSIDLVGRIRPNIRRSRRDRICGRGKCIAMGGYSITR